MLAFIYRTPFINLFQVPQKSTQHTNRIIEANLSRLSRINYCSNSWKVAFTFDDGPHPITTSIILQILNQHRIKAGFFLLGTAIQAF